MQLILVVQVVLLVTIGAGVYTLFIRHERRSGKERRRSNRGGRRAQDDVQARIAEPASR